MQLMLPDGDSKWTSFGKVAAEWAESKSATTAAITLGSYGP
jgi:hypothetical protein